MQTGKIHIGISGWSYQDWKGLFYPQKLKSTDWLTFYANTFSTTEINASFYHLPLKKTVENWVHKVPDDFLFCPKMSQYVTHIQKLKNTEESLERFFQVFEPMHPKMGPVLIQLPPSLVFDYEVAEHFYKLLSTKYSMYSFAMEVRHSTWMQEESITLMAKYNIAFVISQSGHGFPYAEHVTADNIYIRFHGPHALYKSNYTEEMLLHFSTFIKKEVSNGHTIWAYFNNCYYGNAINNALQLIHMTSE
ncbi:Uncharacterized conserved protein YecE, DUF72 family [Filimonas lacunae]|uniref:Uncharacterized conserved protein YecE, DUF72 family n=1 Tax=Filimonas lacunae TaxID=477680 RepID=A0A173MQ19_9BACT|nr:DUF72 domain-containing protein [Filimonas lacunae]BAV09752.1 hypothetical protein FLA_5805 [Filimonas lacunae]SIS78414.1 Uncharacterized conserved protein YecE, DUF72 family [Filimonas lacunae]